MKRKSFILLFLAFSFIVHCQENRPHIILIMTDQHRADALGCMGNEVIITPHLDQLAEEGVTFVNGYSSVPSCTPARAGLLTGLSPWNHGMLGYGRVARKYEYEMPQMLKEAGYYTFGIGKMHWFPQKTLHGFHGTLVDESGRVEQDGFVSDYRDWFKLNAPGEDPDETGIGWNEHAAAVYQLNEELHPTSWTGKTAIELIHNYDLIKPLYLKVSFARPHSPYDPPQRYLDMYEDVEIPEPFIGDWCHHLDSVQGGTSAAFSNFGVNHAETSRRHYYANITFIDEMVGEIIKALKEKGMYKNSIICFTSDHGDMLGDHHHWRKTYAYEGSANIPYLLKWPNGFVGKLARGGKLENPVELRDFLPTFLDAADVMIPDKMDGMSLLDLIIDPNSDWRPYIDLEHATCYSKENYWCALTDGTWKYIWFFSSGKEQLFNLKEDPGEEVELSENDKYEDTLKSWRRSMINHLKERGEEFVKNGELTIREEPMLYSPNFPEDDRTTKQVNNSQQESLKKHDRLRLSSVNPHLLETQRGTPVFLNNYTSWELIKNGTREEIADLLAICKAQKFNMISSVLLSHGYNGSSAYGTLAFEQDSLGNPNPLKPMITPGNDPQVPGEYDYWDHAQYLVDLAAENGMYITLHPTWGNWVSGAYSGPVSGDLIIFNEANAYKYGQWLGQSFGSKCNLLWMVGGDRSARYDLEDGLHDYSAVWSAMAEGLADGTNGVDNHDEEADYSDILISFHPRKWAPNSSEWFHKDDWLAFNSIQDTPYDQIVSAPHDYNLIPVKPTWLFEGRYEGATSAWAVRYQAYQTVLAGGFGSTYGSDNWKFPPNWRELVLLPGVRQMAYLYTVVREIWSDAEFFDRIPDQTLIIGDQGDTKGDGMTIGDGDGGPISEKKANASSDRITAMRGNSGKWAMVYSANGRDVSLDLSQLYSGKIDAYWFNPRNGMWWVNDQEFIEPTAFNKGLTTGSGSFVFKAPGIPGPDNDWVLVLK